MAGSRLLRRIMRALVVVTALCFYRVADDFVATKKMVLLR
jgi:hypothetical protein